MTIGKGIAAIAVAVLALGGCAEKSAPPQNSTAPADTMATVASGIALPAGYKIDGGRTMIFGAGDSWSGRLSYSTKTSADDVFDFLHREMPNFGWTELAAMRSDASLLTFVSETTNRIATVHINRGSMLGSTQVDMMVAPREPAAKTAVRPTGQSNR